MEAAGSWYLIIVCMVTFFWSISLRTVFFTLAPLITSNVGLSVTDGAIVVGLFLGAYSVGTWLGGFIRQRATVVILVGIWLALLAGITVALWPTKLLLMLVAPFLSFGLGLYFPKAILLLACTAPAGAMTRVMSWHEIAAYMGLIVGPLYVGISAPLVPWRTIFAAWVGIGIFPLLLFAQRRLSTNEQSDYKQVVSFNKMFLCFVLLGSTNLAVVMGLPAILPLLMVNEWHISTDVAAKFIGVTRVAGLVSPYLVAVASDRWGRAKVYTIVLFVSMLALLGMTFSPFGTLFTMYFTILMLLMSSSTTIFYSLVNEKYPRRPDAAAGSIGGTAGILGNAISPILFGYLMNYYNPSAVFATAASMIGFGIISLGIIERLSDLNR